MENSKYFEQVAKDIEKLNDANEQVTRVEALLAVAILEKIRLEKLSDYMLYASSVNLLNRYVKLNKKDLGYRFKDYLYSLVYTIIINRPENIKMELSNDSNMRGMSLLMIDIMGIHFSFHSVNRNRIIDMANEHDYLFSKIEWDNIRKQQCASTLFKLTFNEESEISRKDRFGENVGKSLMKTYDALEKKSTNRIYVPYIKGQINLAINY